jgi:hypothetical protein
VILTVVLLAKGTTMAAISWTTGTSGVWGTATNWTPAAVPTATDDVTIDAPATTAYTVTVGAGTAVTANTLSLDATNNKTGVNADPYVGAILEMDGTLTLSATAGTIGGALQSQLISNGGTFINAGTVAPFIKGGGNVVFSGTNPFYVQNELQSNGTVTVDEPLAELVTNTLTDGIFASVGAGTFINLGGAAPVGGTTPVIVNIATVQGPADQTALIGFHGWTELTMDGPASLITEYNGTAYVSVETSLTTIGAFGIVDEGTGRGYTTANALAINAGGIFNADGGQLTFTGGLNIAANGVFQGSGTIVSAVTNNGTMSALAGPTVTQEAEEAGNANTNLTIAGALAGTGIINFDTDYKPVVQFQQAAAGNVNPASLTVGSVAATQTINMGATDTLNLSTPTAFLGTINGAVGSRIVLNGLTNAAATVSGGKLVVTSNGAAFASLNLGTSLTPDTFLISGNTLVAAAPGTPPGTPAPPPAGGGSSLAGFAGQDTSTGAPITTGTSAYTGPVAGVTSQFVTTTPDNLNVTVSTPNWFIHTGAGNDAIQVSSGTNVLDGSTGSNFLTGGSGNDTFFVDDRSAPSDIWSTISNFHSGDAATIFGVTQDAFTLNWADNEGAAGFTGLTLHAIAPGQPIASMTLVGYTTADLSNGRLSVSFGTTDAVGGVPGSTYMFVKAN